MGNNKSITIEPGELLKISAIDWFHSKVAELKVLSGPVRPSHLFKYLPAGYDSYSGGCIVSRVLAGRTTDMNVLEALEKYVKSVNRKNDK